MTVVPGEGRLDSPLHIYGRDPGETEVRLGRPFVGASGRILDQALAAAGIRREDCYIDNVVQVRPPGNKWERHRPEDVRDGRERIVGLLQRYRPKVVIALGAEALRASTSNVEVPGIQEARGYVWPLENTPKVLGTVHPAFVARDWVPWRLLLDLDIRKAKRELETDEPLPTREVTIVTSQAEANDLRNAVRSSPLVAVDIENDRAMNLSCVGFAPSPERAWVVPGDQLDLIRELCEAPFSKVLQNGQYDRFFLEWFCEISLCGQAFDTMLGWHALQPELAGQAQKLGSKRGRTTAKSLRFLASIYTRDLFWKDYDFVNDHERYELCGRDCCITLDIAQQMARQLEAA